MKTADHIDRAASTADGLAGRLSERRRARGLTQGQVAVRLGVSRQAVSKWEMGRSAPDLENLALLAELFSCTVDELLIGDAEAPDGAPREARPADAADGRGRTGRRAAHRARPHRDKMAPLLRRPSASRATTVASPAPSWSAAPSSAWSSHW